MRERAASPKKDPIGTWSFVVDVGEHYARRCTVCNRRHWTSDHRGDQCTKCRADLGPAVPERRQARRSGFRTRAEAQAELDRLRVSSRERTFVAPSRQTLAEYLTDDWLPAVRSSLEESTWASYERYLRLHVIPRIGATTLAGLDGGAFTRMYADLQRDGRLDGREGGLSIRTVRYIHTIVRRALRDAVKWGRLSRNPADQAEPPSAKRTRPPRPTTWNADTVSAFLEAEEGNRYHPAWRFMVTTGCRRGEALGLRWADVDLDTARASISQTITAVNHRLLIKEGTKTGRARVIELDAGTVATLRSWRATQLRERVAIGPGYDDLDLVFCREDGQPYDPDQFSREFTRRIRRHGAPMIRLHDLRHTWATLALEGGIHVKVVAERLGHASTAVTLETYSHVTQPMASDAAERVAGLIFGGGTR